MNGPLCSVQYHCCRGKKLDQGKCTEGKWRCQCAMCACSLYRNIKIPLSSSIWPYLLRDICVCVCHSYNMDLICVFSLSTDRRARRSMWQEEQKTVKWSQTMEMFLFVFFHLSVVFLLLFTLFTPFTVTFNLKHMHWYLNVQRKKKESWAIDYSLQQQVKGLTKEKVCKRIQKTDEK